MKNIVEPDQTATTGAVWSDLHCLPFSQLILRGALTELFCSGSGQYLGSDVPISKLIKV